MTKRFPPDTQPERSSATNKYCHNNPDDNDLNTSKKKKKKKKKNRKNFPTLRLKISNKMMTATNSVQKDDNMTKSKKRRLCETSTNAGSNAGESILSFKASKSKKKKELMTTTLSNIGQSAALLFFSKTMANQGEIAAAIASPPPPPPPPPSPPPPPLLWIIRTPTTKRFPPDTQPERSLVTNKDCHNNPDNNDLNTSKKKKKKKKKKNFPTLHLKISDKIMTATNSIQKDDNMTKLKKRSLRKTSTNAGSNAGESILSFKASKSKKKRELMTTTSSDIKQSAVLSFSAKTTNQGEVATAITSPLPLPPPLLVHLLLLLHCCGSSERPRQKGSRPTNNQNFHWRRTKIAITIQTTTISTPARRRRRRKRRRRKRRRRRRHHLPAYILGFFGGKKT
jgi:hypothetical protein